CDSGGCMMAKLTLTMMQRLNLDALLSVQRGSLDDLFTLHDIREKIKVPKAMRDEYLRPMPDGRVLVDEGAVMLAESVDYEFEKEEVRRVQKLLKEWTNFTEGDLSWVVPLKKQLDGAA
ncbi:MAG: hypothetical protein KGL39_45200, partial [Patescibacteria group bacterium]|nr:hypothetical protein [Patescibacteria group bacterium]